MVCPCGCGYAEDPMFDELIERFRKPNERVARKQVLANLVHRNVDDIPGPGNLFPSGEKAAGNAL